MYKVFYIYLYKIYIKNILFYLLTCIPSVLPFFIRASLVLFS